MTTFAMEVERICDTLNDFVTGPDIASAEGETGRIIIEHLEGLADALGAVVRESLIAIRTGQHAASVEETGLNLRNRIDGVLLLCSQLIQSHPELSDTIGEMQDRFNEKRNWLNTKWPWVNHTAVAEAEAELDRGQGISVRDIVDELQASSRTER